MRKFGVILLGALLTTGGCVEGESLSQVAPLLQPDSELLDFGATAVGGRTERTLQLASVGNGAVEIFSLAIEGPTAEAFVLGSTEPPMNGAPGTSDALLKLAPGAFFEIPVFFVPRTELTGEAELIIETNIGDGALRIPLRGRGLRPLLELCEAVPEVETPTCFAPGETPVLDFGTVVRGRTATRTLLVRNLGEAELILFDEKTGLSPGALAAGFEARASLSGGSLRPGESATLPLVLTGREQGLVQGELILSTNDLESPLLPITLRADAPVNAAPVACAALARIEHLDGSEALISDGALPTPRPGDRLFLTAHPDASCSLDAEDGDVLGYQWRLLSRPELSAATLENELSATPWLQADAVGSYQLELTVFDGLGDASQPVLLPLEVLPTDDLIVELGWAAPVDLDAHLIAPGGAPFCSPLDCFWDTCLPAANGTGASGLDWGADLDGDGRADADGDPTTDPVIALDDDGLEGAADAPRLETIRLPRAAVSAGGAYQVGAHFFRGEGTNLPRFEATIRVLYLGQTLLEETRIFDPTEVGTYWTAGELDLATLTGTPLTTTSVTPYSGAPLACP